MPNTVLSMVREMERTRVGDELLVNDRATPMEVIEEYDGYGVGEAHTLVFKLDGRGDVTFGLSLVPVDYPLTMINHGTGDTVNVLRLENATVRGSDRSAIEEVA